MLITVNAASGKLWKCSPAISLLSLWFQGLRAQANNYLLDKLTPVTQSMRPQYVNVSNERTDRKADRQIAVAITHFFGNSYFRLRLPMIAVPLIKHRPNVPWLLPPNGKSSVSLSLPVAKVLESETSVTAWRRKTNGSVFHLEAQIFLALDRTRWMFDRLPAPSCGCSTVSREARTSKTQSTVRRLLY